MTEGIVSMWLKDDGEHVSRGEEIVDIETDKTTMSFEADESGPLHIVERAGSTVPVGEVIATIGEPPKSTTKRAEKAVHTGESAPPESPESKDPPIVERPSVSPLARKLAKSLGVDISTVVGTGSGGRLLKSDIEAAAAAIQTATDEVPDLDLGASSTGKSAVEHVLQLTQVQKTIAQRMVRTKTSVPEFSATCHVDMDAANSLLEQLRSLSDPDGPQPSMNDLIVKAVALALREHPKANAKYESDTLQFNDHINVGVAVAVDEALFVPVVADADLLGVPQIAASTRALVGRVRGGTITPADLAGGTFTISNLGMFGVTEFTAIINAGQAAILSVGAIRTVPVAKDGRVVVGAQMSLTLTSDHRVLYGSDAARFLQSLRRLLEQPVALISIESSVL
jgi:pyruvate dehydrogenase E2 component (dihydrolipoamide acetyltransferase)